MRLLVHEPMKTVSTRMSFIGVPACRPMYSRARSAAARSFSSAKSSGRRARPPDSDTPWPGLVPQVTNGSSVVGVEDDLGVERGVVVGAQRAPVLDGGVPVRALGRVRAALQVVEGGLVRGDHAGAGAGLDRHVADGHARFHRQRADGGAAVLQDVALAAAGADLGDDGQDDVLGGHARRQRALDVDRHGLERLQRQRLGGQHVLHLGGADAERQRAEGAVRGGVRVAADHGHAGLGEAELRARPRARCPARRRRGSAGGRRTRRQLLRSVSICVRLVEVGDRLVDVQRRGVVVLGGDRQVGAAHRAAGSARRPSNACGLVTSCTRCRSM